MVNTVRDTTFSTYNSLSKLRRKTLFIPTFDSLYRIARKLRHRNRRTELSTLEEDFSFHHGETDKV